MTNESKAVKSEPILSGPIIERLKPILTALSPQAHEVIYSKTLQAYKVAIVDSLRSWIASKILPLPVSTPRPSQTGEVRLAASNEIFWKGNAIDAVSENGLNVKLSQISRGGMETESGPVIYHKTLGSNKVEAQILYKKTLGT